MQYPEQYYSITPVRSIEVSSLYTVHYFENFKNYFFPGEKHDFWELIYIDRGEIIVKTDREEPTVRMVQGDLLLHCPNEFHSFYADNILPHNLVVVSFDSRSPAMKYFEQHPLFHIDSTLRSYISRLLEEARHSFKVSLADPYIPKLERNPDAPFGSEQIVVNMLELLLISLYRNENVRSEEEFSNPVQTGLPKDYVQKAIAFMKQNITNHISLEDICNYAAISRSQLQKQFSRQTGTSIMRYLTNLRIEEAKFLIRTQNMNFTEIAEKLCYSSVHHFSKQFHNIVGMSPTEYVQSVYTPNEDV